MDSVRQERLPLGLGLSALNALVGPLPLDLEGKEPRIDSGQVVLFGPKQQTAYLGGDSSATRGRCLCVEKIK